MGLNGGRGLSVSQKKCFCQVFAVGIKSGVLGMSFASWKDGLNTRLSTEPCAASLKRNLDLLGCLVCVSCLCLVCSFLGEWPSFAWKGWRRFLGRIAHVLVRVLAGGTNVWRTLRLGWWSVWDCVGGTGDPAWQLCKAPAEAKALLFPFFLQVKLLLV